MRIIAGKCKGRKLETPCTDMRPTLDRTKETLFNILQTEVPDAAVLDLFAGSGSLGLEAYSRGAKRIVFADIDRRATETIKRNCNKVGCDAPVLTAPFETAAAQLGEKFDLVFIDPPLQAESILPRSQSAGRFGQAQRRGNRGVRAQSGGQAAR